MINPSRTFVLQAIKAGCEGLGTRLVNSYIQALCLWVVTVLVSRVFTDGVEFSHWAHDYRWSIWA